MTADLEFRVMLAAVLIGFVAHRAWHLGKGRDPLAARRDQPLAAALLSAPASLATLAFLFHEPAVWWAAFPAPVWLRRSGGAVALAGFALLTWAQRSLGRQWSGAARLAPDHVLVTSGPYRLIAHPIYAAFLLIFGSTLPISANAAVGLAWIAVAAAEIVPRIRMEEALLAGRFGGQYAVWRASTGRLLPRLRRAGIMGAPKEGDTMRRGRILCAAIALAAIPALSMAADAGPLAPLGFLIGSWEPVPTGRPDEPAGGTVFAAALEGRVIQRTNHADYPAAQGKPAVRHDDLMVIYADGAQARADYWDNEGHVIRYAVSSPAAGEVVFLSDAPPAGPRFRLTYKAAADGTVSGAFEVAPPGKPDAFGPFLSWTMRKVAAAAGSGQP